MELKDIWQNHKSKIIVGAIIILALYFVYNFITNAALYGIRGEFANSYPAQDGFDSGLNYGAALGLGVQEESAVSKIARTILPPEPQTPASTDTIDPNDRKIVKNGSLSLVVNKIDEAVMAISDFANNAGGFVQNVSVREVNDNVKSGTITVKVPADQLETVFDQAKSIAVKVAREDINTQDVTEQYIDLDAQVRNLKREEESYLKILEQAKTIEEILNVSQRLSYVRGQIERIEGQLNYLSRQIEMSTLTISLTSEADVQIFGVVWSPLAEIKRAIRNMFSSLVSYANALIALVFALPVLILWLITWGIGLWIVVKIFLALKKKFYKSKTSTKVPPRTPPAI
ncbi:MAG: hypothetical protein COT81_01565 [Candidatus Buchananbacteria bacterium CG10_big_fil_rev_8_21_14_0_10_42_9]|uniref:DUF4349 domain-containing protein n=1 Tax=Candidatus Buchananbacteria bacterium CG10_big_fil_rev_8_21_14_0_10_42_9 TaxID=1974526 RepID=A0A2H0W3Y1_9BACT|nr:MAG: hypothetical protein COT81_01565 [Candidatus Buchananbacteria bacterium CG10_big_fil_rev_8_21_14_0_10_42_9]